MVSYIILNSTFPNLCCRDLLRSNPSKSRQAQIINAEVYESASAVMLPVATHNRLSTG